MLAAFCLRLACGLIGALTILPPRLINPRFFRTQFLVALGLGVVVLVFAGPLAWPWLLLAVGAAAGMCVLASLSWSLEESPAGRTLIVLTFAALLAGLLLIETYGGSEDGPAPGWRVANGLTAAALLGTATTAMLMGHSYLTAPSMSLLRLLAAMGAAILARATVAGAALVSWTGSHSLFNLEDETVLWLPVRWALGIVGPLALGMMAWSCARLRSTQSATGILYVVVIL